MRRLTVAAALVVVVFVAAGTIALEYYVPSRGVTPTTSLSTISTIVSSTTSTTTKVNQSALLASCSQAQSPAGFPVLGTTNGSQPAVICFRLYYYDSNATRTLNVSQALAIKGSYPDGRQFSAASNFTVEASQNQLVIGGRSDENEGATIAYGVTARPGVTGSYEMGFSGDWQLTPQEPMGCPYFGELVVGDGQPNYVQPTGCISYAVTTQTNSSTGSSSYTTVAGFSYPVLDGYLYFQVVGVSNSTQVGNNY